MNTEGTSCDGLVSKRITLRKLKGHEDDIVRKFKEGVEQQKIAEELGVHPRTIMRFLNGRTSHSKHNYIQEADEEKRNRIKQLFQEGKTVTQIVLLANTTDKIVYATIPEIRDRAYKQPMEPKVCLPEISIEERNSSIRQLRSEGADVRKLALMFNVSIPMIYAILKRAEKQK